jgi:DNA-binding transcriptional regulator YdaS (Cro superfamily)
MRPREVVNHFGTIAAAARVLMVSSPSISQWLDAGVIPIDRQCQIEIITNGVLRADRAANGLPVKRHARSEAAA